MGRWLYDKFKFVFSLKTCSQQTRQCHTRFYQNGCKNEYSPWTYIFYSCAVKTKKKSMGYCLVPEFNHAQESLPCQFFRLFCHICSPGFVGPLFAENQKFCYLFFSAIFRDKATWDVSQSSETCIIFSNVKDDEIIYLENLYCSCPSYETYHFSWIKRLTCALKDIHSFCFHQQLLA